VISEVEVEFPHTPDPPNGYDTILIGDGADGFVYLRTLNSRLIVSFPFLLLNALCSPGGQHLMG